MPLSGPDSGLEGATSSHAAGGRCPLPARPVARHALRSCSSSSKTNRSTGRHDQGGRVDQQPRRIQSAPRSARLLPGHRPTEDHRGHRTGSRRVFPKPTERHDIRSERLDRPKCPSAFQLALARATSRSWANSMSLVGCGRWRQDWYWRNGQAGIWLAEVDRNHRRLNRLAGNVALDVGGGSGCGCPDG